MNVLQVNNYHYCRGGSDRYFLELTKTLRDSGLDVRTFTSASTKNIDERFCATRPISCVDTEKARGIGNVMRFLYSREARNSMYDVVRKFKPDIAHLHIYYGQLTGSILRPLVDAGVPIIQSLHEYKLVCPTHGLFANGDYCEECKGGRYWNAAIQRCNRGSVTRSLLSSIEAYLSDYLGANSSVDKYIAVSNYQKKNLIRLGVEERRLSVLYHFATPSLRHPERSGKYFLFVGRMLESKGIKVLLDAYAQLSSHSVPLILVGSGNDMQNMKDYAYSIGLTNNVEWVGYKSGKELDDLYSGCLALINPSMLNETFGLTCLEAMAQGRPVIASRVGAIPEVVEENVSGLLVEPGSVSELVEAMEFLLLNRNTASEMGASAWGICNEKFSKKTHKRKLLEYYNEILG